MKKLLFFFSALTVLMLFSGCMTGYRSIVVVSDYDERYWHEDHWVYRFYEGDRFIYRRWYQDRWEEERKDSGYWLKVIWEKTPRGTRDDGRKFEKEQSNGEKQAVKKTDNSNKLKHKK